MSRWMTWLPISLKNAAKCDKWYQLQNHSITESLNANGAREKPPTAIPVHAVSLSVEQKPNPQKSLGLSRLVSVQQCAHRDGGRVVTPNSTRHTVDSWVIHKSLYSRSLRRGGPHSSSPAQGARSTSETSNLHLLLTNFSFVTDLSAAGSPAELKHITQRRKRKQP